MAKFANVSGINAKGGLLGGNALIRTGAAALIGGAVSKLTGGNFERGAITSAFAHYLNAESGLNKYTNPTGGQIRKNDKFGSGNFGASRAGGRRTHNGTDYVGTVGQDVSAVQSGKVSKIGYPYGDDLSYRYIEITSGNGNSVTRQFYTNPQVDVGDSVTAGQTVGVLQSLGTRYPGITEHTHIEIRQNDLLIDPATVIP